MIKSTNLLVIDKTDIQKQPAGKELSITDWSFTSLRTKSRDLTLKSDLVIAINDKGETIVLKNRWGINGIVVSHEDYNKFIKPRYENNKPGNTSKKKSFLGRIYPFNFWPFN